MHRNKAHAALCDHISGDRAVDTAGQQRYRDAVCADRHAACTGRGRCVDICRKVAHLDMDGKLRVVHIDLAVGICLGKLAADKLRKLDTRHGEALVAALCLGLEALRREHIVLEIFNCKLGYLLRIFLAAGGAVDRRKAEHLGHRLESRIHVACFIHRLDIYR